METTDKDLNPEQSLRIIRETIDLAKGNLRENGFHFLLWGWLVVIAGLTEYFSLPHLGHKAHLVWAIMPAIGAPISIIYEWRRSRKDKQRNIIHDWYGLVWLAFGISLVISLAICGKYHVPPVPFILALAGGATFVSGIMLRFKPLQFGSIALWLGAVVCLALPMEEHILVQVAAIVLGYLLPGYMLNRRKNKSHV